MATPAEARAMTTIVSAAPVTYSTVSPRGTRDEIRKSCRMVLNSLWEAELIRQQASSRLSQTQCSARIYKQSTGHTSTQSMVLHLMHSSLTM